MFRCHLLRSSELLFLYKALQDHTGVRTCQSCKFIKNPHSTDRKQRSREKDRFHKGQGGLEPELVLPRPGPPLAPHSQLLTPQALPLGRLWKNAPVPALSPAVDNSLSSSGSPFRIPTLQTIKTFYSAGVGRVKDKVRKVFGEESTRTIIAIIFVDFILKTILEL